MENIISTSKMFFNNENDKIMFIIEKVFKAKSLETAVTMEQIIEKGIELNLCEIYPRGKKDGHPWYPHTSTMCGIHKDGTGNGNYEQYLHREFVKRSGHRGKTFVYWVDRSHKAEVVTRSKKAITRQAKVAEKTPRFIWETKGRYTPDEMERKVAENPGVFVIINGKLYKRDFVIAHPEKFDAISVAIASNI